MKVISIIIQLQLLMLLGCSSIYYNFWEKLGKEKRDLLRSNAISAAEEQEQVQQQFKDTLERIKKEYKFEGGQLEQTYELLKTDYEVAEAKSNELRERVEKVKEIGNDLFAEWQEEAGQINNRRLRQDSLKKRKETITKFDQMVKSMNLVESSLQPVLNKFHDQVLYLKHNLNAQALGALKTEFTSIEQEIRNLIKDIEKSSYYADKFINELR